MEIKQYAPICIPTLNRYEHFKRCVESLSRCTHADKTELVIGLDYPPNEKYVEGWRKISEYLNTIKGFKKVTVFKRVENLGPIKNLADIKNYGFSHYDRIIASEDDNEFSPCFLDYTNKALEKYKDDESVLTTSGYVQQRYSCVKDANMFFIEQGNAWGMGLWREKEERNKKLMDTVFADILFSTRNSFNIFMKMPFRLQGAIDCYIHHYQYGDYKRGCICSLYGKYQLQPSFSLVRNWGQDGSGLHSGINHAIMQEEISDATTFDLDDIPVLMRTDVSKLLWCTRLPENWLKRYYALARIVLCYLSFRFKYRKQENAK